MNSGEERVLVYVTSEDLLRCRAINWLYYSLVDRSFAKWC